MIRRRGRKEGEEKKGMRKWGMIRRRGRKEGGKGRNKKEGYDKTKRAEGGGGAPGYILPHIAQCGGRTRKE
jgi:hypothetical protein